MGDSRHGRWRRTARKSNCRIWHGYNLALGLLIVVPGLGWHVRYVDSAEDGLGGLQPENWSIGIPRLDWSWVVANRRQCDLG